MIVINTIRSTLLGEDVLIARTFNEEAKGLLGRKEPAALFFKTRWGIHTFGMNFPIDCLVMNDKLEVKAIREDIKPNRFFFWWPGYKNILELPAGTVSKTGTKLGDVLEFTR
ncbi:MAG: DUF192 domain-containing protein [Patescibacteria group bacterium]